MNRTLIHEQKARAERQKQAQTERTALIGLVLAMRSSVWWPYTLVAQRKAKIEALPALVVLALRSPLYLSMQAVQFGIAQAKKEQEQKAAIEAKLEARRLKKIAERKPSYNKRLERRAAKRAEQAAKDRQDAEAFAGLLDQVFAVPLRSEVAA